MGQDVEHWAGNFGTRFKYEQLQLVYAADSKPERRIHVEDSAISPQNFSCDFNYGYGNSYYIKGEKCLDHKWSNLAEFDFSLACKATEGVYWPEFSGDHWNGGSSLILGAGEHCLQTFSA